MNKEELELLLKAFKLMEEKEIDERKSIATIKATVKEDYVKLIMEELTKNKK